MKTSAAALTSLFVLVSVPLSASTRFAPDVVYGEDNRKDPYEVSSPLHLELAKSTAAQVHKKNLQVKGSTIELLGKAMSESVPLMMKFPVCEKEKFSHQPQVSNCSGFLVAEDIIATAGHCAMSLSACTDYDWVFNYKVEDGAQTAVSVSADDVYRCTGIIKQGLTFNTDFALLKLDRLVAGASKVRLAQEDPEVGTPLVLIGHPSGLPQKIADGSRVAALLPSGFTADLDAFKGNSGSAVFNANTGELLGILVNGESDYNDNFELRCSEVNVLENDRAGEGVSSFRQILPYL